MKTIIEFNETVTVTLRQKTCPVCQAYYAVDQKKLDICLERGDSWFCPNGHSLIYTETEAQKLKKELDRTKIEYEDNLAHTTNRLLDEIFLRREKEKELKRLHAGVCPCCNRSFTNLATHLSKVHPGHIGAKSVNKMHEKISRKK